jgi:hypothetical protein
MPHRIVQAPADRGPIVIVPLLRDDHLLIAGVAVYDGASAGMASGEHLGMRREDS